MSERLKEIAQRLRDMYEYGRDETVYVYVEIDRDVEFDLGQFGYQNTGVSLSDDEYSFGAGDLLDNYPIAYGEFNELAFELDEIAESNGDGDLDAVLARMSEAGDENERKLAGVLKAVTDVFRTLPKIVTRPVLSELMSGPLPAKPLPWPGALRTDLDYTADDFPLRFQPPPGWAWTTRGSSTVAAPDRAEAYDVEFLRRRPREGNMILDRKGRISWINRDDDDLGAGKRWAVWFQEYNGFPRGNGDFNAQTEPLAIDENGDVLGRWKSSSGAESVWRSESDLRLAKERIAEIRRTFNGAPLAGFVPDYDPKTVTVSDESETIRTRELRLGDDITGISYGRVLMVSGTPDSLTLTLDRDGETNFVGTNIEENWMVRPVADSELRNRQPSAYAISRGVTYDPTTIELGPDLSSRVRSDELRLGDDIVGNSFGRVVDVALNEDDGTELVLDRDGTRRNVAVLGRNTWAIKPIAGVDRDSIPSAWELSGLPVEAPF